MKTLAITLILLIPPADKGIRWDVNEVPTQMVITFESGVKASYSTKQVPCHTEAVKEGHKMYRAKEHGLNICYLTYTAEPVMVRSPWRSAIQRTYSRR